MKNYTNKKINIKILLFLALLISMSLIFSSCKSQKLADKDGAATRYKYEELEKNKFEGLFTLNADKTFSPLPAGLPGFSGPTKEADPERYIWYTDNGENFSRLIPKVTAKTPIVIVYGSNASMPKKDSWYLEKYEPLGASIGAHVWLDEDKTMYLSEKDMLKGTSAYETFKDPNNSSRDTDHELLEISGGSVKLPISNVDQDSKILRGLTYDKKYTFKYLLGTKTMSVDLVADAHTFQSSEVIPMFSPYKQTENGYFIINMPIGLSPGFYYISDLGFFYYSGSIESE